MSESSKVNVAVRIRPLLMPKEAFQIKSVKKASEDTICMVHPNDDSANAGQQKNYTYNFAFDEDDSQVDVYDAMRELVDSTLDGHNATIFTYGQTGTGKTYTVLGQVDEEVDGAQKTVRIGSHTGLFMRVLDDLIRFKQANSARNHVVITISILEIYNDSVYDLLQSKDKDNKKEVTMKRNALGDEAVQDIKLKQVQTLSECFDVFKLSDKARSVSKTAMNDTSSRSHAVFMIDILQQEKTAANPDPPDAQKVHESEFVKTQPTGGVPLKKSRLCLVDLAGSERVKKSQAVGKAMDEAKAINKSLSALGNVVSDLHKGKSFVSYRDSKLTLLLKSSFERANAKIMLIANISPIGESFNESKGTLEFADRVMGLKAKQVFMMDPENEQEFLDSLRLHAELCAEMRIATTQYDLHLHGGDQLRGLRNPDGTFAKEIVTKIQQEQKQQEQQQQSAQLHNMVNKLLSQRDVVEKKEKRATDHQQIELKCEEAELAVQTLKVEEAQYESAIARSKEEYKLIKKMTKGAEKAIEAIKQECQRSDEDLNTVRKECESLLQQIEAAETQFLNYREPPPPLPTPLPEPEPKISPEALVVSPRSVGATSPGEVDHGDLQTSGLQNGEPEDAEEGDDDSDMESPPHPRKQYVNLAVDPKIAQHGSKQEFDKAVLEAAKNAEDIHRMRERREGYESPGSVKRRITEVVGLNMSDDEDDDEEEEEEEDENGEVRKVMVRRPRPPKAPSVRVDRSRMKELLKASGLKKAEIEKILNRMSLES